MKQYIIAALLTLAIFTIWGCSDPKNIIISMDAPLEVNQGEEFTIVVSLKNMANKPQELVAIDIADRYLDGIGVVSTKPPFIESEHIPIDNTMSYKFKREIPSNSNQIVEIKAKAIEEGEYKGDFDFCINSEFNFLSQSARTIVK
jgi:hypothetical protein